MIFNNDLYDVIADTATDMRINAHYTNSAVYEYVSKAQCPETEFISAAINDMAFVNAVCLTKNACKWVVNIIDLDSYSVRRTYKHTRVGKIVLLLDDIELIKKLIRSSGTWFDSHLLYTYASIDALKCIWSLGDYYTFIDSDFVRECVGRLDVLQFIDERKPRLFNQMYGKKDLLYLFYINKFERRELAALEWLIKRINLQLDFSSPHIYFSMFFNQKYYDETMVEWLFKHHLEETLNGIRDILCYDGSIRREAVVRVRAALVLKRNEELITRN